MFKLRDIQLSGEFTDTELSNALVSAVVYTYGDRCGECGYDIAPIPQGGADDVGTVLMGRVVVATRPDATMLVTEYTSGKMGVIPMSAEEVNFVQANTGLMQRIATLLGYSDYVVYTMTAPSVDERSRLVQTVRGFSYATLTDSYVVEHYEHTSGAPVNVSGIYHSVDTSAKLFDAITTPGLGSRAAPNGVVLWTSTQVRIPMEYYLTDVQNVQDASRKAVQLNRAHSDAQDAVMTEAFSSVAALVGSLSVFGDSVRSVTERYNNVTQYIPRP